MLAFSQYFLTQYGTYVVFSWDIIEPLTCSMTLFNSIIAYFFWIRTKSEYKLGGIKDFYYQKGKVKLAKKINFDEYHFEKI